MAELICIETDDEAETELCKIEWAPDDTEIEWSTTALFTTLQAQKKLIHELKPLMIRFSDLPYPPIMPNMFKLYRMLDNLSQPVLNSASLIIGIQSKSVAILV